MPMRLPRPIALLVAAIMLPLVAACSQQQGAKAPVVLAAASLQDALSAAAKGWTAQGHPAPVLSFAGTSALARQAEAGAPADLFISADKKWMDELAARGLIRLATRRVLLTNRLVLIAPAGSTASVTLEKGLSLDKALGGGRLAVADPDAVPAGRYAKQALESLGAWNTASKRIVAAQNVRAALALVARKEASLGIVYATDAKAEPGVRIVGTFPQGSHKPIVYPAAVLKAGESADAAAFLDYLSSSQARAVFARYGFGTDARP